MVPIHHPTVSPLHILDITTLMDITILKVWSKVRNQARQKKQVSMLVVVVIPIPIHLHRMVIHLLTPMDMIATIPKTHIAPTSQAHHIPIHRESAKE